MKRSSEQSSEGSRKKTRTPKAKAKTGNLDVDAWPEYFKALFQVYKALNTVLAFCSARRQLAVTFPVIRSSVEGLLKRPLELSQVAELKALLPDLIKFSYIPRYQLQIHAENESSSSRREKDVDYSQFSVQTSSHLATFDNDEHVLVLEFADGSKGKKNQNAGFAYTTIPALSPAASKKLVERRNESFISAANALIQTSTSGENAIELLKSASEEHVPIDPKLGKHALSTSQKLIPTPEDRPSIDSVIDEIKLENWYNDQIHDRRIQDPKPSVPGIFEPAPSDTIMQAFAAARNITSLYSHQCEAINAIAKGQSVIVATSTASGKSVIYQLPLLRFLEENLDATAIFIYPTKALAQDQKIALENLVAACPGLEHIKVFTYDGDTPKTQRKVIRESASVIFTNFDMIHASILPQEEEWRTFLQRLKLIVADELHYYAGLLGSHVAQVVRRLRRICSAVGNSRLQFVSCSATISKPLEHMKAMFGIDNVIAVTEDGAPSGRKDFVIWNPPLRDSLQPSLGRLSSISEATRVMRFLMSRGIRVILFCKIRKVCELAMKTLRADLSGDGRFDILERTVPYRGGYTTEDRRRIEVDAFSGKLLGIVATNALELGVDIGTLDAVIMLGFPFTIASFRQQAGRAGRRAHDSLAILVADNFPLDQHYVQNPQELFDTMEQDLIVDLQSKMILEAHLQCAGYEMPLTSADEKYFGPLTQEICKKNLRRDADGWYHTHEKYLPYPSKHISLRGVQDEKYAVVDVTNRSGDNTILEEVEVNRALFELYEGGVFIHQGHTFIVKEISHDSKLAKVVRSDVNWITEPRDFTNVDAIQTWRIREIKHSPNRAFYGRIEVFTQVFGFFKIRNGAVIDVVDVDNLPWQRETTGLWMDVPLAILSLLRKKGISPAEAIHSAQHAFLNQFSLATDVRTECKAPEKEYRVRESSRKRPARVIFYDVVGQSQGVAAKAFDHVYDILSKAHNVVDNCPCEDGCGNCVQSPSCKEKNQVYSKIGASVLLRGILSVNIESDSIKVPEYDEHHPHPVIDTIVEATTVRTIGDVQIEATSP